MSSKIYEPPFKTASFPHIRDRSSVSGIMWTVALALLPAVISFIVSFGLDAFRTVTISVASTVLAEMGIRKMFGRRVSLYDGSAVITALLYALLLPPALPSWTVAAGAFFAITVGKEIFGGLGQNPFNPALVGVAFLLASFPFLRDLFTLSPSPTDMNILSLSIFAGGIFLILKRVIQWEMPLIYLGIFLFGVPFFLNNIFLAAFFMVTDPATTPLTRSGRRGFVLGTAVLTIVFRQGTSSTEAVTYGILLMNSLNPWLERWSRP